MNKSQIHVGVVEDTSSIRQHLEKFLGWSEDFELSFAADSVEEGLKAIRSCKAIDILILDIGLPGISGLEGIPWFKEIKEDLDIVMFTVYDDERRIVKALCSGASSYLTKSTSLEEIGRALKIVHEGGSYMSPSVAREITNHFLQGQIKQTSLDLRTRQVEIVERLVEGKSNEAIGKELFISANTVRYYIKSLYKALQASNKAEAIAKYLASK